MKVGVDGNASCDSLVDEVAAIDIVANGERGIASDAFEPIRWRRGGTGCGLWIIAGVDVQNGDLAISKQAISRRVVHVVWHPGPRNHVESLDAAGELQIVDNLRALVVDMLVDEVNEGLLFPRKADSDVLRGGGCKRGGSVPLLFGGEDADVVARGKGV